MFLFPWRPKSKEEFVCTTDVRQTQTTPSGVRAQCRYDNDSFSSCSLPEAIRLDCICSFFLSSMPVCSLVLPKKSANWLVEYTHKAEHAHLKTTKQSVLSPIRSVALVTFHGREIRHNGTRESKEREMRRSHGHTASRRPSGGISVRLMSPIGIQLLHIRLGNLEMGMDADWPAAGYDFHRFSPSDSVGQRK